MLKPSAPSSSPPRQPDASEAPAAELDLDALFGDDYRLAYDSAYSAERGDRGRAPDPLLRIVLCRHGQIYIHGPGRLGVSTTRRGSAAAALAAVPGVEVLQEGDDGINVAFPPELFSQVAAIVKPRKRRRLSPEHRKRLVEMGTANLNMVNSTHVGFAGEPQIPAKVVRDDQRHVPSRRRANSAA
jgi:hypothetical protein